MNYGYICDKVTELKKKYDESDPFRLCKAMGIILNFLPLGKEADATKGFFIRKSRISVITVNSDLPTVIQRIIVAHELGHAVLHGKRGAYCFHEVAMFDESSVLEKDANIFAAEFLMDDEEVIERLNADSTFFSAASSLYVPIELLDFKFRVMKWKGFKVMEAPIMSRSNFLKDMDIPEYEEDYIC